MLLALSCSGDSSPTDSVLIQGSGNIKAVTRDLPACHSISLEIAAEVSVRLGAGQRVVVAVQENIHEYIELVVSNGVLIVRALEGYRLEDYDLEIHLTLTDVEMLSCSGAGIFDGETAIAVDDLTLAVGGAATFNLEVDTDRLYLDVAGAGTFYLSGQTDTQEIIVAGTATVAALDLDSDTCEVEINGIGILDLAVEDYLDVEINGNGTVRYRGDPDTDFTINGTGSIAKLD